MEWKSDSKKSGKEFYLIHQGRAVGSCILTPKTGDWCASTDKAYLGRKMLLDDAKAAVEDQVKKEMAEQLVELLPPKQLILPDSL